MPVTVYSKHVFIGSSSIIGFTLLNEHWHPLRAAYEVINWSTKKEKVK